MPSYFYDQFSSLKSQKLTDFYALFATILNQLPCQNNDEMQMKRDFLGECKKIILNHNVNLQALGSLIEIELSKHHAFSSPFTRFFNDVLQGIEEFQTGKQENNVTLPTNQLDLELRFARYLESKIVISILEAPMNELKNVIHKISYDIIMSITYHKHHLGNDEFERLYSDFLYDLGGEGNQCEIPNLPLAFGRFPNVPDLNSVCQVLKLGNDIPKIMLIHFMFMRDIYPQAPRLVSMALKLSTKTYHGEFETFVAENGSNSQSSRHIAMVSRSK